MNSQLPKICLCGRPNVGKSALFNRLLGRKKAIVLDQPGVTRDVRIANAQWDYGSLELADLAGLEGMFGDTDTHKGDDKKLQHLAEVAALDYLKQSDLILFVVDARAGVTPLDEELSRLLRKSEKPILVVLSKVENEKLIDQILPDIYSLGFSEALATSAEHNLGIGDLKERVSQLVELKTENVPESEISDLFEELEETELPKKEESVAQLGTPEKPIHIGVYGRPNTGKSTFVNWLLGSNRMITSEIAGTTVDTIDSYFKFGDKTYCVLDTAGIRRKSKTEQGVEVLSVVMAIKSIEKVNVAFFMIDGFEGITDQDEKIAGELVKAGKPIVLLVNKWDICRISKEKYAEKIRETLGFLDFAPILFISAKNQQGLDEDFQNLWDLIDEIIKQRMQQVPTAELNRMMELLEGANNPLGLKIYFASHTSKNPPTITFMVNDLRKVHYSYEGFLKNELRERFGWLASPLKLLFRPRKRRNLSKK